MATHSSPIVLFVYNRLWHTRQTIEALQKNELAGESDLFIFADGPRSDDDRQSVQEVRDYLKTIGGFKRVTITLQDRNLGLARSIISGVTEIVGRYGRIIVLEDDIVTGRYFLRYMNDALSRYERKDRVMHISGYMFPLQHADSLPETFFYRGTSCWGWGTWERAWEAFEPNARLLLKAIDDKKARKQFDILGTLDYYGMLKAQAAGKVDSWAVRWYASVFLKDGLCLHPFRSLARNIGHDSSGTHCGSTGKYDVELSSAAANSFDDNIRENQDMLLKIVEYNKSIRPSFTRRAVTMISRILFGRHVL